MAAIDVGTNAARVKIARVRGGTLEPVHAERAAIAPGEGVFTHGRLTAAAIERLLATLSDFVEACRFHRATVRAVATSALRSAVNGAEVAARVRRETGVTLEIINGAEEARLTALGVLSGRAADERALCIDVGGGSTEIILGQGETPATLHSIDVGGVRLAQRVGDDLPALRHEARAALRALPARLGDRWMGADATAIGCSGSVRALVSFATEDSRRYVTRRELSGAIEELARMSAADRARFFDRRRAAVILPAAVVVEQAMVRLGTWAIRATRRGLRDGILVDLARARASSLRVAS